jgi:hypothetical protein
MKKPSPVTAEQVNEWIENPVTIAFLYQTWVEREEIVEMKGLNAFHPFQPERTQEVLANLNGYADALDRQIAALEEGWIDDDAEL